MCKIFSSQSILQTYLPENLINDNMFDGKGNINPKYNSHKVTGVIAKIFEDHWLSTYSNNMDVINRFRSNANKEIEKIIKCANKDLGCDVYECPNCHDIYFIGHTCKSRLCSSCGYKYKLLRVENILETAIKCNHRQIVFTIPEEMRKFFFDFGNGAIDILFKSVNETIHSILNNSFKYNKHLNKKKSYHRLSKFTPGFFSFLHTFGRDLKWNPHIHVLIAEIKLDENGKKFKWDYFNFDALSKRFQLILLNNLRNANIISFWEKSNFFTNHKKGFYVYAEKKKFKKFKDGVEYVTRYCGRSPISENRIKSYDGKNVTFWYNDHRDNSYKEITVSAEKFILMVLRHLLPENFKIIRYYGFYRNKKLLKNNPYIKPLLKEKIISVMRSSVTYKYSIMSSFNRNPYKCDKCYVRLKFLISLC